MKGTSRPTRRVGVGRRSALVAGLAAAGAAVAARAAAGGARARHAARRHQLDAASAAPELPSSTPWRIVQARIQAGRPNGRLGLVQAQHIFGKAGAAAGYGLVRAGLVRVRIPASLARQGDEGWRRDRFEDGWWMERLRDLGVPFKTVLELGRRTAPDENGEHAARVARRVRPDSIIVGNEVNAAARPATDSQAEIDRYLDQYAAIHAAVKAEALGVRVQLYGEAYDGEPRDRNAFLRRVLSELRRRALPPPDAVGIHVYDGAAVLPARVAGYRELLADAGMRVPISIEELGPRHGILDDWEWTNIARRDPHADRRYHDLRANGWLTEDEHANLVVQQLATAATCADQAQVFCAIDFDAEIAHRRGLMSNYFDRARPALSAFRFTQRLLNDLEEAHLTPAEATGGVVRVDLTRRDGLRGSMLWRPALDPDGRATEGAMPVEVPPFTFVCDARGYLVVEPAGHAQTLHLPVPTSPEAGGAVRILL